MASSGPDRSITGISLPQWMKSKISDRYDLEQTPFSPPNNEDGFFLVKYKKAAPEQAEPPKIIAPNIIPLAKKEFENATDQDVKQFTTSCQKFMPNAPREVGLRQGFDSTFPKFKSAGTDDGFKGENAACGYSVVAVAHQMIAERSGDKKLAVPPMNQRIRRNSKSLPASPQTSPKLLRKNPYFTNIIFGSSERVESCAVEKTENTTTLTPISASLRDSVEELSKIHSSSGGSKVGDGDSVVAKGMTHTTTAAVNQRPCITRQLFTPSPPMSAGGEPGAGFGQMVPLKAKPSHLREMNFWSPTSM